MPITNFAPVKAASFTSVVVNYRGGKYITIEVYKYSNTDFKVESWARKAKNMSSISDQKLFSMRITGKVSKASLSNLIDLIARTIKRFHTMASCMETIRLMSADTLVCSASVYEMPETGGGSSAICVAYLITSQQKFALAAAQCIESLLNRS
jgi:aminoglycoside phosphotransferase family enzyme